MSGFTIQQVLGTNSIQDINGISLSKEDLNDVGLTTADQNDGEALFTSLILQAYASGLDADNRDGTDELNANPRQQVAINPPVTTFVNRQDNGGNTIWVKRDSYTIDFDVFLPVGINPNSY